MYKNKIKITLLFALLCTVSAFSQDFYWYRGEKVKIEIDSTKVNITVKENADISTVLREVQEIPQQVRNDSRSSLHTVELQNVRNYSRNTVCFENFYYINEHQNQK